MDVYGPPLPPGYVRPDDDEDESDDALTINLPSSRSIAEKQSKVIGPQCPAFLSHSKSKEYDDITMDGSPKSSNILGPELSSSLQSDEMQDDESSGDELYGPLPSTNQQGSEVNNINEARIAIEKRAENMKNKLENKDLPVVEVAQREEWMTVPDTSRKNQLGAISRCLAPAKSSSSREKHSHRHSEKDKKTAEELKKYNKSKRSESLLQMHQKSKKKKEKKSKHEKEERKAFDRDEISIKQFSKQQVNSVIDKAKYLNSRFSAGNKQYL